MMERKRIFRSGVVLLELMAAILIFALAGAVCVQVLIKADALAAQAENLDNGVNYVSSAAEVFRAAESETEAYETLKAVWPQGEFGETTAIPFESGELQLTGEETDGLSIYWIRWICDGEIVYELELCRSYGEAAK